MLEFTVVIGLGLGSR